MVRAGVVLAQHPEHVAQLVEGVVGLALDLGEPVAQPVAVEVVAEGQGAGLHRDLGDAVRQHVVHLAGDARPLGGARLGHPQLLLALGALGAGAQVPDDLAARADVEAPAHHPGVDRDVDQRGDHRVVVDERGDRGVGLRGRQVRGADGDDLAGVAAGRDRDRSERRRARRHARQRAHRGDRQRDRARGRGGGSGPGRRRTHPGRARRRTAVAARATRSPRPTARPRPRSPGTARSATRARPA